MYERETENKEVEIIKNMKDTSKEVENNRVLADTELEEICDSKRTEKMEKKDVAPEKFGRDFEKELKKKEVAKRDTRKEDTEESETEVEEKEMTKIRKSSTPKGKRDAEQDVKVRRELNKTKEEKEEEEKEESNDVFVKVLKKEAEEEEKKKTEESETSETNDESETSEQSKQKELIKETKVVSEDICAEKEKENDTNSSSSEEEFEENNEEENQTTDEISEDGILTKQSKIIKKVNTDDISILLNDHIQNLSRNSSKDEFNMVSDKGEKESSREAEKESSREAEKESSREAEKDSSREGEEKEEETSHLESTMHSSNMEEEIRKEINKKDDISECESKECIMHSVGHTSSVSSMASFSEEGKKKQTESIRSSIKSSSRRSSSSRSSRSSSRNRQPEKNEKNEEKEEKEEKSFLSKYIKKNIKNLEVLLLKKNDNNFRPFEEKCIQDIVSFYKSKLEVLEEYETSLLKKKIVPLEVEIETEKMPIQLNESSDDTVKEEKEGHEKIIKNYRRTNQEEDSNMNNGKETVPIRKENWKESRQSIEKKMEKAKKSISDGGEIKEKKTQQIVQTEKDEDEGKNIFEIIYDHYYVNEKTSDKRSSSLKESNMKGSNIKGMSLETFLTFAKHYKILKNLLTKSEIEKAFVNECKGTTNCIEEKNFKKTLMSCAQIAFTKPPHKINFTDTKKIYSCLISWLSTNAPEEQKEKVLKSVAFSETMFSKQEKKNEMGPASVSGLGLGLGAVTTKLPALINRQGSVYIHDKLKKERKESYVAAALATPSRINRGTGGANINEKNKFSRFNSKI